MPSPAPGELLAVSVSHLSKVFLPSPPWMKVLLKSAISEPVVALDDVSFQLRRGEICVVVGPNGAGKSTLFRILTGLTTPSEGQAQILGHDIDDGPRVRSLLGYMPAEDRNLMLRHTCAQNLAFRGKLQGIPSRALANRVDETLDQVGILHARDQAAVSLSTGMRARLQLAAALLHEPEVLILDEPTSTVDPVGAHELLTLIEELTVARGISIVSSSHRLEEIDALGNKVIFLDRGRVIHDGNLAELRKLWERPRYRIELAAGADPVALGAWLERQPLFEVDVVDRCIEVSTPRPLGDVMAAFGPSVNAIVSFEQVVIPLRVLFHKLVSDERNQRP
jgi:ABC-2 type transport system ATP-binding protein